MPQGVVWTSLDCTVSDVELFWLQKPGDLMRTGFALWTPHFLVFSDFLQWVFSEMRDTAVLHYFRGVERYKNERNRIEIRTLGTTINKHLICRSLPLVCSRNDGSVERCCYFEHVGKGKPTYMSHFNFER